MHESIERPPLHQARPRSRRRFLLILAIVAGILILIVPRLLSSIVAIYLIIVGLIGLNAIHHFIR